MPVICTPPWSNPSTKKKPTCDFYLPEANIYVEVKGFMTYEAVSKLLWFTFQPFNYYILQGTEIDWNPFFNTHCFEHPEFQNVEQYLEDIVSIEKLTKKLKMITSLDIQISELEILCNVGKEQLDYYYLNDPDEFNTATRERLEDYIVTKKLIQINWLKNLEKEYKI